MGNQLIPLESINAIEIFTPQNMDNLLTAIRKETATFVPDISTPEGRKEVASTAYKIARSKTTIDNAGRELVADWKKKSGEVDAMRKKARDYLDALKDEVRAPLTEWEAEQARIEQEKAEQARFAQEAEEQRKREELERREAEVRAKEEAIAKAEAEILEKEQAEQREKERLEYEERVRKEAEGQAKRDAEEALRQAERAVAQAKRDAEEAKENARLAAEKAERDKAEAIRRAEEKAKREADEKERARLAEENRIKAEQAKRDADIAHRKSVNRQAIAALIGEGIEQELAKQIITLIASGSIPNVRIHY